MQSNVVERHGTDYPGVFYRVAKQIGGQGDERVFYVRWKDAEGEGHEEKVGRQFRDDMTAARASHIRTDYITGRRQTKKQVRAEDEGRWTLDKLFEGYLEGRPEGKSKGIDTLRYNKYLKLGFGKKLPSELDPLSITRLRVSLSKTLSPQTVAHILGLLGWIINWGIRNQKATPLSFKIIKPTVRNQKTEMLTDEQFRNLVALARSDLDKRAGGIILFALATGMRRSEMVNLKWDDLDWERHIINIRHTKAGKPQMIPISTVAREILDALPKEGDYVFNGIQGRFMALARGVNRIKEAAGIPKDFRGLHGLRHHFASALVQQGVPLFTVQALLRHSDPRMTNRYAHLTDKQKVEGVEVMARLFEPINGTAEVIAFPQRA